MNATLPHENPRRSWLPWRRTRKESRDLLGNSAPVPSECHSVITDIEGELPAGLRGHFLQVGPNPVHVHDRSKYHPFDGDGMIHQVRFDAAGVTYNNRWVDTSGLRQERSAGRALWRGLKSPPNLFGRHSGFKNVANTAMVWHAGSLLAMWEGGHPHSLSLPDLDTNGPELFGTDVFGQFTAHPKLDPRTGELVGFGASQIRRPYLEHFVIAADGKLSHRTVIEVPRPTLMHDFAITENFSVFLYWPLLFDLKQILLGRSPWRFDPSKGAKIGVLPRYGTGSDMQWFDTEPGFGFHTVNAYEEDGKIVLDSEFMPEIDVLEFEIPHRSICRWTLDLTAGTVDKRELHHGRVLFPHVDPRRVGVKHEHVYMGFSSPDRPCAVALRGFMRLDLETGDRDVHDVGPGRWCGEPRFVAKPGGQGETDGWLVALVYCEDTETSELIVVDAANLAGPPIARVKLARRVPFGFHTLWVDADASGCA